MREGGPVERQGGVEGKEKEKAPRNCLAESENHLRWKLDLDTAIVRWSFRAG